MLRNVVLHGKVEECIDLWENKAVSTREAWAKHETMKEGTTVEKLEHAATVHHFENAETKQWLTYVARHVPILYFVPHAPYVHWKSGECTAQVGGNHKSTIR